MKKRASREERAVRARRVAEMRRDGMTYEAIGKALGVTHATVMADAKGAPLQQRPREWERAQAMLRAALREGPLPMQRCRWEGKPVLLNEFIRAVKAPGYTEVKRREQWVIQRALAKAKLRPMRPIQRLTMTIWHPPGARPDPDAFGWHLKAIVDAMKGKGLLAGEDARACFPASEPFATRIFEGGSWETLVEWEGVLR